MHLNVDAGKADEQRGDIGKKAILFVAAQEHRRHRGKRCRRVAGREGIDLVFQSVSDRLPIGEKGTKLVGIGARARDAVFEREVRDEQSEQQGNEHGRAGAPPFLEQQADDRHRDEKDAAVAPEPDQSCYGEASSAAELDWLLEKAAPVLEGQNLFFSTDRTILPGSTIHYYLDETIFAISWKEDVDHMAVTYSEVKIMDPSQIRRHLSGGSYASGTLMLTSEMSKQVNAVMAFSGDFYDYRQRGTVVHNGTVYRTNDGLSDICYVDENGDLLLERHHVFDSVEDAQQYMDEKGIRFSLAFGPILVEDYQPQKLPVYFIGQLTGNYSREALCQMDRLHYLVVVCNYEKGCFYMPTGNDLVKLCQATGCIRAYNLDGGQTSTVVMNNEVLNSISYGSQRLISDIFYFATAKPKEN